MKLTIFLSLFIFVSNSFAIGGNKRIESFNKAKKELSKIYMNLEKRTIYCKAYFDGKNITNKNGFKSKNNSFRDNRIEWEHVVPAKKFGHKFDAWKKGHKDCFDNKGKKLGNRDCAQKVSEKFRRMQSDMYNLYPAIGTVNIMRADFDFVDSLTNGSYLGSCKIRIYSGKVLPPDYAKGKISRAYLYMAEEYPFKMRLSYSERKRFEKWNKLYPATNNECKRGNLIYQKQGNINKILKKSCKNKKSSSSSLINQVKEYF